MRAAVAVCGAAEITGGDVRAAVGEPAHTTSDASCPRVAVEIYVETSDMPIAGGRWLIGADSIVIYERPPG